ncbi:MAG: class I SAM-dependent methyltransferase [Rhodopila sp.]|nr:class I SAM-dependent methyltransferase [Rhodopila sp.]
MLSSAVRSLFGRSSRRPPAKALTALAAETSVTRTAATLTAAESPIRSDWPAARLALADQLWGPGFIFPGGEIETLRLARPLGVSAAASLLLVGVGSGGPASAVARNLGTWVTGMDVDPGLLAAARSLIARSHLGKKVSIKAWDPDHPVFDAKSHHHCLALEPLHGVQPEPILDGLARALKPGGQLVLTELAAETPLNPHDPTVSRWGALERRDPAHVLPPVTVTRMLGRVGLDVRIAEDISHRHLEHAMLGWRVLMRDLRDRKPTRQEAARLVAEAELWLLRRRLVREGRLKMMRWHAISRARDQAGLPSTNGLSSG